MSMSPENFTYENLNSLKFRELQKLSVRLKVSKRWARKQELINLLLGLKDKKMTSETDQVNWVDGSVVFSDVKMNEPNSESNKRLTFNLNTKNTEHNIDPRLTFNVIQQDGKLLDSNDIITESRQTYEIPNSIIKEDVVESRATFTIDSKNLMSEMFDSRATFNVPKNEKKSTKFTKLKKEPAAAKVNNVVSLNKENLETNLLKKSLKDKKNEIKVLSIPNARVTRRKKNDENSIKIDSPIKLSKKSINIKKSVRQSVSKLEVVQSPALLSTDKSVKKINVTSTFCKTLPGKFSQSKIPSRLQFTENNSEQRKPMVECSNENNKKINNIKKTKSQPITEVSAEKQVFEKVSLLSPNTCVKRSSTHCLSSQKASDKKELEVKVKKPVLEKPKTVTKMPDFTKIHQKQFAQMDSLDEYLKKKEERSKRLFGIPQPGSQIKGLNKSVPVFQFQSSVNELSAKKDREKIKNSKILTPSQRNSNNVIASQKKCLKTKLAPITIQINIKDKNRSHIYGVRTNKRFELQMKFRNK